MIHFGKRRIPVVLLILVFPVNCLLAQKTHSDNNDGTYTNPVIFADFPDPDVILVADTYYMVSTTMFIFPGVTILKSCDLVNWEYCRVDNWPIVGVNGKGVVRYKKPNVGKKHPIIDLPASDEFSDKTLGMQWGWNHNPDSTKWSLARRPEFLSLETTRVVSKLPEAPNMLTQRIFANYDQTIPTVGTTRLKVKNMKDGDVAGLAVFQDPYAFIAVKQNKGSKFLIMVNNGKAIDSLAINNSSVYLRTIASNNTKKATFEFSFDNKTFTPLGNELSMRFNLTIFTGNKFCLFNYATYETGGHVDFDWFRMQLSMKNNYSTYLNLP